MTMLTPPLCILLLDPVAVLWVAIGEVGYNLPDARHGDVPGGFFVLEKPIGVLKCSRDEAREIWIDRHVDTSFDANHWRAGPIATNGCWPPKSIDQISLMQKEPRRCFTGGALSWFIRDGRGLRGSPSGGAGTLDD
ncbi:hypothetical protein IY145_19535 [Methylosinus sp. H3A]|uniref:hypothetical protein n=1 Tax=Methylosinus sp. H3A TaxID=2785786 RepID=UPI0018C26380|nr:hypothetical protein [Methylosinus sp. H3A]MBG0811549.1 hypothetical protein [Methylosinus sp. H3A]